ncbi:transmembrane channel-like protein 7 isoform X1 [Magallana gigas]|uniref:transmembrane channel-like protein 7 isoform X1 n=2 Tax=Magallana gigas TaxID=29159 RepID=UPI00333FFF9D
MATGNSSGGDKGYGDLCNTLCPEEREPLMSAEGRKLAKKRRELGDDVSTSSDSELVNRRPKSETPPVDVSKLRKERDKKYQSQPLELLETSSSVDFDRWRKDHTTEQSASSSPDSDRNNTRERRQLKFKSQPEEIEEFELSHSWDHRMYDGREHRPRASAPPLGFDDQPGPSRRRDYQSGPPVGEPLMDYDEGRYPDVDRQRQMPSSSRDDSARYYRGSQMPPSDYRNDMENNNIRDNGEIQLSDVFPSINKSDGKGTLIRHRRKSSRKGGFGEVDYDSEEDDGNTLPSQRAIQRNRTKSIKERKLELEEEKRTHPRPKTLAEKYHDLRNKGTITAGDVATIVRESTLTRMHTLSGTTESKAWHKFQIRKKAFLDRFTIWAGTLKEVEGQYGTAAMTYFRFIKWLMFLNIYIMIIMFCVITVPYLALGPFTFNSSLTDANVSGYREAIECTTQYEIYHSNLTETESIGQQVLDLLQGTGWMERRILFYGVYYNKTYTSGDETYTYNMGLAYMLAFGGCFLLSFLLIVKNASKNVKVSLGSAETMAVYSNMIFSGWDFCINQRRAAKVKRKNIFTDIQAELHDQRKEWRRQKRSGVENFKLYAIRFLINLLVLALLGGALYLITFTAEQMIELQNQKNLSEIVELLVQYIPFVTITVLNAVLPIIFQKLVQFEDYRYEFGFKLTLARAILLRLASPIALIAILYKELIERPDDDSSSSSGQCGNKQWISDSSRGRIMCWETYFGQQLYKLVLLDLIVETGIIFFMQVPRWYLNKKYGKTSKLVKLVGPQEFDLPQSVVDIIYTQSICWLGMFFSPLIPFMTFVKCVLFFWVKKLAVLKINVPQERPIKTSGSNSLFMLVLLLSFIIAAGLLGYMIGNIPPSQSCGPYRVYSNQTGAVMFNVVTNTVQNWPTEARDVFEFLGTVGFFIPVVILLVLLMYYYWLRGQGYKKTEELLQEQLKMEGRDKKYLLDRVNEVLTQNADLLS